MQQCKHKLRSAYPCYPTYLNSERGAHGNQQPASRVPMVGLITTAVQQGQALPSRLQHATVACNSVMREAVRLEITQPLGVVPHVFEHNWSAPQYSSQYGQNLQNQILC